MKMRFYDNDFDRMFDEAVEEMERKAEYEAKLCDKWAREKEDELAL